MIYPLSADQRRLYEGWGHAASIIPSVLHLNALYLEPGIEPDDELVAGVATAMRDFLSWHGAESLKIEKSDPAAFGEKVMSAL